MSLESIEKALLLKERKARNDERLFELIAALTTAAKLSAQHYQCLSVQSDASIDDCIYFRRLNQQINKEIATLESEMKK